MMPKGDTIHAILKLNPTAAPDFLAGFSAEELDNYLQRLADRRNRLADRPAGLPAIRRMPRRPSVAPR